MSEHAHMGDERERVRSHYFGDGCKPPHEEAFGLEPMVDETKEVKDFTPEELKMYIQALSDEFDKRCQARHEMGEEKYGAGTWLGIDSVEMAIEELIDLANYTRFAFIKYRLIQAQLGTDHSTAKSKPGNEMMGKDAMMRDGFMSFRKDQ